MTDFESLGRVEGNRRRAAIVAYLREQAERHQEKADENPDDSRSRQSAIALEGLADFVEAQPEQDLLLTGLAFLEPAWPTDAYTPGREVARLLSEYGFHDVPLPDQLLIDWAEAAKRDARLA
jgi:hypothetical protein